MELLELLRSTAARTEGLMRACQKISEGIAELTEELEKLVPKPDQIRPASILTARQMQIFALIGQGVHPEEIAKRLKLSRRTVEAHRDTMRRRLNLPSVNELNEFAKLHPKG